MSRLRAYAHCYAFVTYYQMFVSIQYRFLPFINLLFYFDTFN